MKIRIAVVTLLVLVAAVSSGCGLAQNLMGSKGGTVSTLWSDVPPLPNATQANINIPPLANILVQGFIQAANADSNSDTKLDKFDFIGFQTSDTPQQVADFYTLEKMKAAGWNSEDMPGCQAGAGQGGAAGFCAFGRKDGSNNQTVLLILPVQDDASKQTQVFFIRFEGSKK
ncbi:MAG: hypothetical protein EYC68_11295 [Chloroflexota bacterium]|nr:MAG: hypothetical protein EYC68_11295 [Chloroflexota bacterium]